MSTWARRARKKDGNHSALVRALRQVGATVEELHAVGGGVPDLLVGYRGANHLLEVKNPDTRYGQGRKSGARTAATHEAQADWHQNWRGRVVTVRTVEEALVAIGAVRRPA